ncbi:hypothetical protein B5V91_05605 [Heyndrickxia sporothermodurans]|nr:hypothetical protein B5V91_05605 [Heyndrickxia sporothermodurans]PTY89582.1 hypothetical protein B5V90_07650 [Heyndrickxia sporothermodurans]
MKCMGPIREGEKPQPLLKCTKKRYSRRREAPTAPQVHEKVIFGKERSSNRSSSARKSDIREGKKPKLPLKCMKNHTNK